MALVAAVLQASLCWCRTGWQDANLPGHNLGHCHPSQSRTVRHPRMEVADPLAAAGVKARAARLHPGWNCSALSCRTTTWEIPQVTNQPSALYRPH